MSAVGPYGAFSPFSLISFKIENDVFPTLEHFLEWNKFKDANIKKTILSTNLSKLKKYLSKLSKSEIKLTNEEKIDILRKGVEQKFKQNKDAYETLMKTENDFLIFDNKSDNFLGISDGQGKNMLGKVLMETRDKFKYTLM